MNRYIVNKNDLKEIEYLVKTLNYHTDLYEKGEMEITDFEWDQMYFRLSSLERLTGYILPHSPTQNIRYSLVNELSKINHDHLMLSLAKTKDREEAANYFGDKEYVVMAKMDGLTCSLTYENGYLVRAETRGDGAIGDDVTHNVLVIKNVPRRIEWKGRLVIDGEVICDKETFKEFSEEYKNPRNFAAGSIRLLDSAESANRKLKFVAWDVIEGFPHLERFCDNLLELSFLGFEVVPWMLNKIYDEEELLTEIENFHYPIDGLVYKFDDIAYGKSLGATDHHFKNAIALKFADEEAETSLVDIDWTLGRTGILTPVAVFKPVELEGTTVQRASVHNITIFKDIFGHHAWYGQKVKVYKAHMINPQILEAEEYDSPEGVPLDIPEVCPVCGGRTEVKCDVTSEFLICTNPDCEGKLINRIDHFAGKKGLDIKGLSKATLGKLIEWGWIEKISDLYELHTYRADWINKPGFGERSVDNILRAIEDSKTTTLDSFIASLGIPLVGKAVAKDIIELFSTYEEFRTAILEQFDFGQLNGFAEAKTSALLEFDYTEADYIFENYLKIFKEEKITKIDSNCNDLKIVITGTLKNFKNREQFKEEIEKRGGKVVNTITKTVNFLINNDVESTSSKNKKAKELNVPIISEDEFINKYFN